MKNVLVYGFLLSMLLQACTKTTGIDSDERNKLIINKKWQLVKLTTKTASGTTTTNDVDSFPSYRKDDYLLLKPDSTYEFNDNTNTRPGLSSPILDAGNWQLLYGNKVLEMHSTVYSATYLPFDILELTATTMQLQTKSTSDGSVVQMTFRKME